MTELKIMNLQQALFYADNGIQPIRIERGLDNKLVLIYTKEETFDIYCEWCRKCRAIKQTHI